MIKAPNEISYELIEVISPAFSESGIIPIKYTCEGANVNPPVAIGNLPAKTKSLAIVMDDPDAPVNTWVHWIVWDIPVTHLIKENTHIGIEGMNDFQHCGYEGPCPFSGTHRYHLKIYALDALLSLPNGSRIKTLEKAMSGHILAFGEMIGIYKKRGDNVPV